jgi:hypothetical protein
VLPPFEGKVGALVGAIVNTCVASDVLLHPSVIRKVLVIVFGHDPDVASLNHATVGIPRLSASSATNKAFGDGTSDVH